MDKTAILDFTKHLEENPFTGKQQATGRGEDYWTADMWTMDVAKYMYWGHTAIDPKRVPRVRSDVNIKLSMYNHLKNAPDCPYLLVCEVGRGLDIMMAKMIREWKTIYCYDHVDYGKYLKYFGDNIEFQCVSTHAYKPQDIRRDVIMVVNHSIIKPFTTDNIIYSIVDGEVWKG